MSAVVVVSAVVRRTGRSQQHLKDAGHRDEGLAAARGRLEQHVACSAHCGQHGALMRRELLEHQQTRFIHGRKVALVGGHTQRAMHGAVGRDAGTGSGAAAGRGDGGGSSGDTRFGDGGAGCSLDGPFLRQQSLERALPRVEAGCHPIVTVSGAPLEDKARRARRATRSAARRLPSMTVSHDCQPRSTNAVVSLVRGQGSYAQEADRDRGRAVFEPLETVAV